MAHGPDAPDTASREPLPRSRERAAIAALTLAAFALNLNTNVMGPLLDHVDAEFGLDGWRRGLLLAAAAGASALGALWVGPHADRHGRRAPLLAGLAVFAACSLLHVAATTFTVLLALRALSGAAVGVAYACASAMVAELVPYERRGAAMGVFTAGLFLAVPLGLPLAIALASAGSWQGIFVVQCAVAVLAFGLAWRAVPRDRGTGAGVAPLRLLTNPTVLAAMLAVMLHVGPFFTTAQLAGTWLNGSGLLPRDKQSWLWVGLGLASVFGAYGFGSLSDRIGKRRFVLASSVVLVAGFVALAAVRDGAALLALGALVAVGASARTGPLQALTSGQVPQSQLASLMGLRAFSQQMGIGLCALGAGLLLDRGDAAAAPDGGFGAVLWLAALCQLGSGCVIWLCVREPRQAAG